MTTMRGNQNAAKEGRDTHFHIRTSAALKGAAKVAAMPAAGELNAIVIKPENTPWKF